MATRQENQILAVVANDVKHLIEEVGEIKTKVTEINGGLRTAQRDVAVMQSQNQQHCKCIEDLYEKHTALKKSVFAFIGIGAAVGSVVTGVVGVVLWIMRLI